MRPSAPPVARAVVAAVALLGAAVLGAGVSVALAPAGAAQVAARPFPAAKVSTVTRPAPAAKPPARPVAAAPTVSNIKASFVSSTTDSVTVEGVGSISGTPDILLVNLQVTVQRDTTGAALDGANAVVERLISTLESHGVAARDIQTTGLSLSPTYDYDNNKQTQTGYAAGQSLTAKLRSAQHPGRVISAASAVSQDVSITGLSFDLENNTDLLAKAQNASFAMAKQEAARYAGLAGRRLGRVLAINQLTHLPTPMPQALSGGGFAAAAPMSDVPLAAGSQPVSVSVIVSWALR